MRKSSNNLVTGMLALVVSVVAIGLAYAGFTQTLNINGTGNVVSSKWDIYFANLSNAATTGTANVVTPATISPKTKIGDYYVELASPGDSVTYTFDVVNDGDFDAKLTTLAKSNPTCTPSATLCNYLTYTLTYTSGGATVAQNDTLLSGEVKNMTLKLMLRSDIPASALSNTELSVSSLGITLLYSQDSNYVTPNGGGNSEIQIVKPNINVYSVSNNGQNIGDVLTVNNTSTFNNSDDALDAYASSTNSQPQMFTAHITDSNDVITDSYVGFIIDGEDYYLKGAGATFDDNTGELITASPYYNINKLILDTIFGSEKCVLNDEGTEFESYNCYDSESRFNAVINVSGGAFAGGGGGACEVFGYEYSYCERGVED